MKARVANAVFFALDADPLKAATNALRDLCVIFGARIVEAEVDRVLIQPT